MVKVRYRTDNRWGEGRSSYTHSAAFGQFLEGFDNGNHQMDSEDIHGER